MAEALPILHAYLAQLASRGVTHVPLDERARKMLMQPARGSLQPIAKIPVTISPPPTRTSPAPAPTVPATAPVTREATSPSTDPSSKETCASIQEAPPSRPPVTAAEPLSKEDLLAGLAREAEGCQRARDLGSLRDTMVFAVGNPNADIMFIGEAPGAEEEKQREPFVGPAGQLLTKIIQAMGLRRSEVYISNVCKFRPKIEDGRPQGSRNRAPTVGEMLSCQSYILAEINIVKPRVIVCLGATASTGLGIEGTVGKLRGTVAEWRGIPRVVTYHPSYLLRQESEDGGGLREKRLVWEDMMRVMEVVGLPISAKQRGYFSKAR